MYSGYTLDTIALAYYLRPILQSTNLQPAGKLLPAQFAANLVSCIWSEYIRCPLFASR